MKNYFNDRFLFVLKQNIFPFLNRNKKDFWAVFSIFLVGFSVLAAYVMLTEPHYIDVHISEEIQEKQNGFLDSFMKAVSWFGRIRVSAVLIGCSTILFLLLKRKKDALLMLSTLISGGIAWVLKTLINRPDLLRILFPFLKKPTTRVFRAVTYCFIRCSSVR